MENVFVEKCNKLDVCIVIHRLMMDYDVGHKSFSYIIAFYFENKLVAKSLILV